MRTTESGHPRLRWTAMPRGPVEDSLMSMGATGVRLFVCGDLTALIAREPVDGVMLWQLSISHPTRYPTWDEIADARYGLLPDDRVFAMLLPPAGGS